MFPPECLKTVLANGLANIINLFFRTFKKIRSVIFRDSPSAAFTNEIYIEFSTEFNHFSIEFFNALPTGWEIADLRVLSFVQLTIPTMVSMIALPIDAPTTMGTHIFPWLLEESHLKGLQIFLLLVYLLWIKCPVRIEIDPRNEEWKNKNII